MKQTITALTLFLFLFGCSSRDNVMHPSHLIVFFGDSITELGIKPKGYVSLLRESLSTFGQSFDVIGAGISGNKVTDLQSRLRKDVLAHQPTIVVLYIGINDVWHYEFAARGLSGTPKDQFESGLKDLISTIRSAGAQVILCTPTVIGEKTDGSNKYDAMLDDYSTVSRNVAAETGSPLCDLRSSFLQYLASNNLSNLDKDILTYDGVHLNDAGNRLVAEEMLKVLDGMGIFFPQK